MGEDEKDPPLQRRGGRRVSHEIFSGLPHFVRNDSQSVFVVPSKSSFATLAIAFYLH
jgi:hypothetical protein